MALTDESGTSTTMLVQPSNFGGGYSNGFGDFGNGGAFWILLLFILLGNGAWGNGFGGGFGGTDFYPWMNQSNQINGGFRDQMLNSQITGIQSAITSGFGDVQTALCGGFAGVNAGIANGFAQAEIANNASQMANMNQTFALQSALQNCCCENRAGLADVKYTVLPKRVQTVRQLMMRLEMSLHRIAQIRREFLISYALIRSRRKTTQLLSYVLN